MADTTQDGAAPAETQAPVAGADPRAWREMAERFAVVLRAATAPAEFDAAAFPALTALREAVDECERLAREERVAAGWLATIVIDRLGGTPDVPAWVAQSAENYQRLTRERDEAERMGHDAVEWIGVVRDLLVDAGYQPGDRDVALANLRTLVAAAARGAEGERGVREVEALGSANVVGRCADLTTPSQGYRRALTDVLNALAPSPSAGPAAPEERTVATHEPPPGGEGECLLCSRTKPWGTFDTRTGAVVCVDCRDAAAAARASDDPARGVLRGVFDALDDLNVSHFDRVCNARALVRAALAAPAAPEVP